MDIYHLSRRGENDGPEARFPPTDRRTPVGGPDRYHHEIRESADADADADHSGRNRPPLRGRLGPMSDVSVISERYPPCGWVCVRSDDDRIEYRPEQWRFELTGAWTADDVWELRCSQRVGEAESTASMGFVPTRETTVRTLFDCMHLINQTMSESGPERVLDVRRLRHRLNRDSRVDPEPRPGAFDGQRPGSPTRDPGDPTPNR